MKINLNWVNRSNNEEGTRLYRSLTPFDESTLPEPLAVLPKGANSYVDEDIVRNTLYYYRTEVFKGQDKLLSPQSAYMATSHYGPGPEKLAVGDFHLGYFGTVPSTEFFTPTEVVSMAGVGHNGILTMNTWYKFAYRGKILYIPTKSVAVCSWMHLQNANVVHGEGPTHNLTWVPDQPPPPKIISRNDDNYIVRLPTYLNTELEALPPSTTSNIAITSIEGSEWYELMGRMIRSGSLPWFSDSYSQSSSVNITSNTADAAAVPIQENTRDNYYLAFRTQSSSVYTRTFTLAAKSSGARLTWFPVLELKLH